MSVIESAIFGILQGVFEWLPISSTGELMIIMIEFFGYAVDEAISLSLFLHIGTSCSAVLYFRKDVVGILYGLRHYHPGYGAHPFSSKDNTGTKHVANIIRKDALITFLVISTIISGALGYIIFRYTSEAISGEILLGVVGYPGVYFEIPLMFTISGEILLGVVGVALIATGIIQRLSSSSSKPTGTRTSESIGIQDTILLGIVQAFSAIPGLSRSGLTVSAFLMRGYTASESLRLSFLMGIPAILAAQAGIIAIRGLPQMDHTEMLVALTFSFVFGYLFIRILIGLASRIPFWIFTICIGSLALLSFVGLF